VFKRLPRYSHDVVCVCACVCVLMKECNNAGPCTTVTKLRCVCVCVCLCVRMSPLHVSVLHDNVELTSLLLQHGALVDSADKKGLIHQLMTRGPDAACISQEH